MNTGILLKNLVFNMAKNSKKEIEKIDRCISDLVYDKQQLKKAYNYYHSIRDPEQFRYLEENYGIGTPTSVSFTPLVKKHIDVLVGEYLTLDPEVQVTCKDDATISNIMRDKKLKIDQELFNYLQKYLKDRKGKNLSAQEIMHYQRIVVALLETAKIMEELN